MELHIKLREGFKEDTVKILLDGKEVYHKAHVTTNYSVSVADAIMVTVDRPFVKLRATTGKGYTVESNVGGEGTRYVDIWIAEGGVHMRESDVEEAML